MKKNNLQAFAAIVICIVVVIIGIGFVLAGSPSKQRTLRFDQQRSDDLLTLENALFYYWQEKGDLPEQVDQAADGVYQQQALTDPETSVGYPYSRLNENEFMLCANFSLSQDEVSPYSEPKSFYVERTGSYFIHPQGQQCYTITLDRELYDKNNADNNLSTRPPIAY